jgi:hypothetical protein
LCANANGVDDRHRRHTATGDARGSKLAVPDHRKVPAALAVGAGGHQFADSGQRP